MKFICDGLDLNEAIVKVSKALGNKITNPILDGIKITAKEDTLTLFATDLELAIEKKIKANVFVEGETVVPGRLLGDLIRKLTQEQIEASLNDKNQLKIRYTDSEVVLQCFPSEDYPKLETFEKKECFSILQSELKRAVDKSIFAVSTDDGRPILKGCLLKAEDYTLTSVALDGYRMAIVKQGLEKKTDEMKKVVPSRSLNELSKLLDDDDLVVNVYLEKNYLLADLGDTTLLTRLLVGEYLNYEQLIPKEFSTTVVINKNQFENALERASILAREEKRNNLVKFDIKENVMTLESNSEIGNISEKIAINLTGKDLNIAFNARYLSDSIKAIDKEFIKMSFTSPVAPCIITPCDGEEFLYLILPVRII